MGQFLILSFSPRFSWNIFESKKNKGVNERQGLLDELKLINFVLLFLLYII